MMLLVDSLVDYLFVPSQFVVEIRMIIARKERLVYIKTIDQFESVLDGT